MLLFVGLLVLGLLLYGGFLLHHEGLAQVGEVVVLLFDGGRRVGGILGLLDV